MEKYQENSSVNIEAVDFVQQQRAVGFSDAQIKNTLTENGGWNEKDVEMLFLSLAESSNQSLSAAEVLVSEQKTLHIKLLGGMVSIAIFLIVLVLGYFLVIGTSNAHEIEPEIIQDISQDESPTETVVLPDGVVPVGTYTETAKNMGILIREIQDGEVVVFQTQLNGQKFSEVSLKVGQTNEFYIQDSSQGTNRASKKVSSGELTLAGIYGDLILFEISNQSYKEEIQEFPLSPIKSNSRPVQTKNLGTFKVSNWEVIDSTVDTKVVLVEFELNLKPQPECKDGFSTFFNFSFGTGVNQREVLHGCEEEIRKVESIYEEGGIFGVTLSYQQYVEGSSNLTHFKQDSTNIMIDSTGFTEL